MNHGAWSYIEPRFETATDRKRRIRYAGRAPSAATAAGAMKNHIRELEAFINKTFE